MQSECSVKGCMKCAIKDWCDHPMDTNLQKLIAAVKAVGDPNFIVK